MEQNPSKPVPSMFNQTNLKRAPMVLKLMRCAPKRTISDSRHRSPTISFFLKGGVVVPAVNERNPCPGMMIPKGKYQQTMVSNGFKVVQDFVDHWVLGGNKLNPSSLAESIAGTCG